MADATNEVRLWRTMSGYWRLATPDDGERSSGTKYIARPRADDDAREERLKAAEAAAKVCREDAEFNATRAERIERMFHQVARDRDEWRARAEKAEARLANVECIASEQYAALRGRAEKAEADRDEARANEVRLDAALRDEAKRGDEARALLREARPFIACDDEFPHGISNATLARIDAALGDAPTHDDPTEADRRGEDGAWCERGHE